MTDCIKRLSSFFVLLIACTVVRSSSSFAETLDSFSIHRAQLKEAIEELNLLKSEVRRNAVQESEILKKVIEKISEQDDRIKNLETSRCDSGLENKRSDNKTKNEIPIE